MGSLSWRLGSTCVVLTGLLAASTWADDLPKILELQTQHCPNGLYFHIRFARPADMESPSNRLAQLIPQDSKTSAVYPQEDGSLAFTGKIDHWGKAVFKLIYPSEEEAPDPGSGKNQQVARKPTWSETSFSVDLQTGQSLPTRRFNKPENRTVSADSDLEDRWAYAQARNFYRLAQHSGDFGFYRFAAQATARKYGIRVAAPSDPAANVQSDSALVNRQLYETTTGSAAITESLALHRMLNRPSAPEQRVIDIGKVPGIDIAEHPWVKMMGDRKPSPEPLAKLVPHDNYYVHFKNVRKLIEFGELLDQWGTNVLRGYEINSRDYRLQERYEKQLCLKSTWLGKHFGDKVIRSLAVTGNDPYLREGSDVTVIFHVVNRNLFLAAVEPFLQETRKEFGGQLRESQFDYRGDIVESFATPLREVNLYRATVDEFVIYSNSPVGVRRCLDTYHGRSKALAQALDFQYMRTVFRLEDDLENGFAFLPDAFIRQLVGPASKIKEKRRLEALTSLQMATNGALFAAWENGKTPESLEKLQAEGQLRLDDLVLPEGGSLTWDNQRQVAVSDVYNTIHFATPLVELPIERVTRSEDAEYRAFRTEYLGLWRRYFDPVGMRFHLTDERVRIETYILPLIRNNQYDSLFLMAGRGTIHMHPSEFAPNTLAQLIVSVNQGGSEEQRVIVRLDDGPILEKLAAWWRRGQQNGNEEWWQEAVRMFFQLPVVLGIEECKEVQQLVGLVESYADSVLTEKRVRYAYNGFTITRAELKQEAIRDAAKSLGLGQADLKENQNFYHVLMQDAWYVSFNENAIKNVIDHAIARKANNGPVQRNERVEVNSSFYVAPKAFNQSRPALRSFLEWETQRRALANNAISYPLYRTGIVAKDASEADMRAKAFQWFGFIPVSPDGAAYTFDASNGEVVNQRHGSLRQPLHHAGPADGSPLAQFLEQLQTVRADLRFREDGVQTVVTMERKGRK